MNDDFDPDEDIKAELAAQDAWIRRHQKRLSAHPDCRDPDHPGCKYCEDTNESDD